MDESSVLRVMVVEDQVILAMELELVLRDLGCDVVGTAGDRAGALALADLERPALALVDVNLSDGMTGPAIAQTLVAEYGTTVVFLTANPEQIPDGFSGALGVVRKPFDAQTIKGVVAFARQFILHGSVAEPPRRFQLASWLATSSSDAALQ